MDVVRMEAALLRAGLPDLVLRPGMTLHARVLERSGALGLLMLAGTPLTAELPDDVAAGTRLRLRVERIEGERVVLHVLETPAPPRSEDAARPSEPPAQPSPQHVAAQPPPDVALPLPGGRQAEVRVTERSGGERGESPTAAVSLSYDSPFLGRLEMRLAMHGAAGVEVTVAAPAGAPEAQARRAAEELRGALTAATGRPASVRVIARHPPERLDVYA